MALPGLIPCPVGTGFSTGHFSEIYNQLAATERCISLKAVICCTAGDLCEGLVMTLRLHRRLGNRRLGKYWLRANTRRNRSVFETYAMSFPVKARTLSRRSN